MCASGTADSSCHSGSSLAAQFHNQAQQDPCGSSRAVQRRQAGVQQHCLAGPWSSAFAISLSKFSGIQDLGVDQCPSDALEGTLWSESVSTFPFVFLAVEVQSGFGGQLDLIVGIRQISSPKVSCPSDGRGMHDLIKGFTQDRLPL